MLVFDNKLKYGVALLLCIGTGIAVLKLGGWFNPRLQAIQAPALSGERIHIPDQRGRLTWVSSWSVSCALCLRELPDLEALHLQYGKYLQIVALALPADPPNAINDVKNRLQLTLPVVLDLDAAAARQLTPDLVVPSHHLVDSEGRVLLKLRGALHREAMLAALQPYLPP